VPVSHARIETERPSRYLVQFCKHAAGMGAGGHAARMRQHAGAARGDIQVTAEWCDSHGAVTFNPWGRCELTADESALTVRIDAADEDGLRQIQDIITRDLDRFSRRDPLAVTWRRPEQPDADQALTNSDGEPASAPPGDPARGWMRTHRTAIILSFAAVVVIGLHLGLAGALVAQSRWTGVATNTVLAVVLVKIAFVVAVRVGRRRRRSE
jgi:hypothetical protein